MDIWEELNNLEWPNASQVDNSTDFSIEELEQMTWIEAGTEESDYSTITATTYTSADGSLAKKVFSDGFVEYYEVA